MINKKWLGGIAGVGVVAATFGFAATIGTINTESIGGANATVAACTDTVDVSYEVSWNGTEYVVDSATVDVSGDAENTCTDGDTVGVTIAGGGADDTGSAAFADASDTVDVQLGSTISAEDIDNVHVVIGGVAVS